MRQATCPPAGFGLSIRSFLIDSRWFARLRRRALHGLRREFVMVLGKKPAADTGLAAPTSVAPPSAAKPAISSWGKLGQY
jgi:hypothetical protein